MATFIEMGDLRWALEPVGRDTRRNFDRVADVPPRQANATTIATLWKRKGAGQ